MAKSGSKKKKVSGWYANDLFSSLSVFLYHGQTTPPVRIHETGPISRILSYGSPLTLVVPDLSSHQSSSQQLQLLALRLAHNLLAYLNIDCNIVYASEIDEEVAGGTIVFGGPRDNAYASRQLVWDTSAEKDLPIYFEDGGFVIGDRTFDESDTGKSTFDTSLLICALIPDIWI